MTLTSLAAAAAALSDEAEWRGEDANFSLNHCHTAATSSSSSPSSAISTQKKSPLSIRRVFAAYIP